MTDTDKSFAENVIIAVVVDLVKSFLIFCSAVACAFVKQAVRRKNREQHDGQPKETKDTIPDEELFE